MYRCLGPGNTGIKLSWDACLPLAARHGFEGIDVPVTADLDVARCRELLAKHGLKPGGMGLPFNFRADEAEYRQSMAGFEAVVEKAVAIGQTRFCMWILPFSDTLPCQDNFRFHVDRLGPAAAILAKHGCRLGLEFIGPRSIRVGHKYGFVRTLEHMLELGAAMGPNVGLLLDSWHWHMSQGTLEDILALKQEQVVYVHINDAPAGIPMEQQEDLVRQLPGDTGVQDLPGFLGALRRIGYDGPVVVEPFVPELGQLEPEENIRRVGESLKRVWSLPARPAVPTTMKAVATGRKKAWLVDLPVPRPQGAEVVVKLHAAPICGSNMGAFLGDGEWVNTGHEGAGEVVAVAHSNLLKVGDRVALAPLNGCGCCPDCQRGDAIFCAHRPEVHGYFAQFTRLTDSLCTKIPDDLSYEHASLMGCALGPAYESIKRLAPTPAETLVVSGLGPVGLGVTALAVWHGTRVVVLDPEAARRERATKLGAAVALDPTAANIREQLRKLLPAGVACAVECSGKPQAERLLIDAAGIRGRIAFVGENQETIPVSPSRDLIRKGLTLMGCWHMSQLDASELIVFLRRNPAVAEQLISHRFGFSQAQAAFDLFATRTTAKVILLPWQ